MSKPIATRQAFGEALAKAGEKYPQIVVLDADLAKSTKSELFAKKFPDRFFEMGTSTIFTVYLTLNALRCFPDILSCGRTWLVLTLPVYILILPLVGKITTSFLLAGFLIISPIYITVSYYIGKNIESLYSKFK
jgi:hypothetical protein